MNFAKSKLILRTLLDIADDVAELADLLSISKFGIIGYSAGGLVK